MAILDYIEFFFSKLLYRIRAHDAKLFTKSPAFTGLPEPTISLECPECGPSGSLLKLHHTQLDKDKFPTLQWSKPETLDVKEYIMICEDVDVPIWKPIYHGIFYSIPADTVQFTANDVEFIDSQAKDKGLKSGFRWIDNLMGRVYMGPKPLIGHGPHRYFYQLVALKEPLDLTALGPKVTQGKIAHAIEGKVAGWGVWVGVFQRNWE